MISTRDLVTNARGIRIPLRWFLNPNQCDECGSHDILIRPDKDQEHSALCTTCVDFIINSACEKRNSNGTS